MPLSSDLETLVQRTNSSSALLTKSQRIAHTSAVKDDLANVIRQLNVVYKPLVGTLASLDALEALDYGISGNVIFTHINATSASAVAYYDTGLDRARTIKETIDVLLAEIARIENSINIIANDERYDDTELRALVQQNNLDLDQIVADAFGGDYTLDGDGLADLNYSLAQIVDAMGALFTNYQSTGITYSSSYPTLSLTALGAFITVSNVTSNSPGDMDVDDFVFGSDSLDDDGDATHDARFMFDKSKGFFAAGRATGTEWDAANRGTYSAVFGDSNKCLANNSIVTGLNLVVNGGEQMIITGASSTITDGYRCFIGGTNLTIAGTPTTALILGAHHVTQSTIAGTPTSFGIIGNGITVDDATNSIAVGSGITLDDTNGSAAVGVGHVIATSADKSVILGGEDNTVGDALTAIVNSGVLGGHTNLVKEADNAAVIGGNTNTISGTSDESVILGGYNHTIAGALRGIILGGTSGSLGGGGSAIIGGLSNTNNGSSSGIFSGTSDSIDNATLYSVVLGGELNVISGDSAGGATVDRSAIIAGYNNALTADYGGGNIDCESSAILAGNNNIVGDSFNSVIIGGNSSVIDDSTGSVILGGDDNLVDGSDYSAVLNGQENRSLSDYSTVRGRYGVAYNYGSHVVSAGAFDAGDPVQGQAQHTRIPLLRTLTTNGTAYSLQPDGDLDAVTLSAGIEKSYMIKVSWICRYVNGATVHTVAGEDYALIEADVGVGGISSLATGVDRSPIGDTGSLTITPSWAVGSGGGLGGYEYEFRLSASLDGVQASAMMEILEIWHGG